VHFSPDGKSILLVANGIEPQLWVVPFPESAGTPRRIFREINFNFVPRASWMPDSRHAVLSFSTGGAQPALWLADLKREKLRRLTASTATEEAPSLAPDGRRLVFTSVTDDFDLIELPLDGAAPRTLLANSRNMYSPSWSPDGEQLIYATDRSGSSEIWSHHVKAGIDRPMVTARDFPPGTTTALAHPVFSPDGSRFAFVRFSTDQPATIWVEPTVGGAPIKMASEYMVSPTWSPDGNSIAGLMHRDRPWQPAIIEVGANMSPHVIAGAPTCLMPMEWSPTGEWLACEAREGIELFSPDGSRRRTLPRLKSSAIAFARDGRTLYAAGRREYLRESHRPCHRLSPRHRAAHERPDDLRRRHVSGPPQPFARWPQPDHVRRGIAQRPVDTRRVPDAVARAGSISAGAEIYPAHRQIRPLVNLP
jgi:Tol biopolymer transport system component